MRSSAVFLLAWSGGFLSESGDGGRWEVLRSLGWFCFGFLTISEAVALTFDADDFGVVEEAVEDGGRAGDVA
jgi:hypothetical protein